MYCAGLYLTGGLTPKNIDLIQQKDGLFMHSLLDKGRVSGMLFNIPIYAVMVEDLGERGAEYMGLKLAEELAVSASSKKSVAAVATTVIPAAPANSKGASQSNEQGSNLEWIAVGTALAAAAFVLARNFRR